MMELDIPFRPRYASCIILGGKRNKKANIAQYIDWPLNNSVSYCKLRRTIASPKSVLFNANKRSLLDEEKDESLSLLFLC